MDGSHVCLLDVKIMKPWFDNYKSEDSMVCFGASIIVKILSLYLPKTTLRMQTTTNMDKLEIDLIYPDNIIKSFEIPLIDMDTELLEAGTNDYSVDLTMKTKVFDKYISEILMFGEVLSIKNKEDDMYFSTTGNEGRYQVKIPHENMEEFLMDEDLKLSVKTNAKYLAYASKLFCVFKNVQIKVDNHYPLMIYFDESFSVSGNKKENEETEVENDEEKQQDLTISYYVAPKIEDDEVVSDIEDDDYGENEVME